MWPNSVCWLQEEFIHGRVIRTNLLPLGYNSRHKGTQSRAGLGSQAGAHKVEGKKVLPATFHTLWLLNCFKLKLSFSHSKIKMITQAFTLFSLLLGTHWKEATRDQKARKKTTIRIAHIVQNYPKSYRNTQKLQWTGANKNDKCNLL